MLTPLQEEYKHLYESEIQRRDALNQATDRPVAIITAFVGVVYFTVSELRLPLGTYAIVQLALASAAIIAILVSVYFIVRSNWNHMYVYVPTAKQLADYRESLKVYFDQHYKEEKKDVDANVLSYIYDSYVAGAHANAENNRIRSAYLHKSKTVLIIALLIVIALGTTKAITPLINGHQNGQGDRHMNEEKPDVPPPPPPPPLRQEKDGAITPEKKVR